MTEQKYSQTIIVGLLFLALIAYCLPWVVNPGASLSLGAYDLAEWTSLHPLVRGDNPTLLTTLLLRLPLVGLGLLMSLGTFPSRGLFRLIFPLLIGLALLPPLEFFTQFPDDPNYRQQFALSAITVIGGILCSAFNLARLRKPLYITISLGTVLTALLGLIQSHNLMLGFSLSGQVGLGAVVFGALLVGLIAVLVADPSADNKQGSPR